MLLPEQGPKAQIVKQQPIGHHVRIRRHPRIGSAQLTDDAAGAGLAKLAAGVGREAAGGGGGGAKLSDSSAHASAGALLTIGALAAGEGAPGTGRGAVGRTGFVAGGAAGGFAAP